MAGRSSTLLLPAIVCSSPREHRQWTDANRPQRSRAWKDIHVNLSDTARQIEAELIALRRELHRHPEPGLELPWTQRRLLDELEQLPVEVTLGTTSSSITAVLRGGAVTVAPAPAVLIRGDMDALPVTEDTGLSFASEIPGAMHACGHDLHMTMAVGAARILAAHREELVGDVVFMFQPGEEGHDGAQRMLDEGVLDASGTRVSAAYALHVFSSQIPHGKFMVREGAVMSASDTVIFRVRGKGGHGSTPHRAIDPISASAAMIHSLHQMVTREISPFRPVVLSFGAINGGHIENVIPDVVEVKATVRSFDDETRRHMQEAIIRVLRGVAEAHRVDVEIDYTLLYPPTVNAAEECELAREVITELFGEDRVLTPVEPMSASEDFSKVLAKVPGIFIPIGAGHPDVEVEDGPFNHAPQADFTEGILWEGAALLAGLASVRLARLVG